MQPETAKPPRLAPNIDEELFLDCIHCGLCTASCPTYLELGTEMDSPRGRIYLMRALQEGRQELTPDAVRHLELCLDCRACETACPSGVKYGKLIEPFRIAVANQGGSKKTKDWFHRLVLYPLFPHANRLRWALAPLRLLQRLGVDRLAERIGLVRLLPGKLRQMYEMAPPYRPWEQPLPRLLPAIGARRKTVALFTGCVGDAVFRHVHWATARVLQVNGCDVLVPREQTCCGAIHFHSGAESPALAHALRNAAAFDSDAIDAVVVNVAGCGAMLKDYADLPAEGTAHLRLGRLAAKVRDVAEFLLEIGPVAPNGRLERTVVYHDACHLLHAQKIRSAPRQLLKLIPGVKLVSLEESDICCGAAGTYNLTEPVMAERLVQRKVANILAARADAVATANAGCLLHISRRLRFGPETKGPGQKLPGWIGHPIEILDESYEKGGAYRDLRPPGAVAT